MRLNEHRPTRRGFLSGVTAAVVGVAGCLSDGNNPKNQPSTTTRTTETETDDGEVVKTAPGENTQTSPPSDTPEPSKPLSPPFRPESGTTSYGIELAGSPVIANTSNPPVDIYYWSDYQCAYCKQFEMSKYGAFPQLVRNDVAAGRVRVVLLMYPNYGPHSWTAHVMAKCLWHRVKDTDPSRFWKWHHTVFKNQGLDGEAWSSRKSLLGYARKIKGIDARALDQCMRKNRKQYEKDIREERKRARSENFSETPGFVMHHPESDRSVSFFGAQPYSTFERQINAYRKQ